MTTANTLTIPAIDESTRADRLAKASVDWAARIAAEPTSAQLTYRVRGAGEGSVATLVTSGRHEFLVDEPEALAGDDAAASPVELALGALIACQVVVYRLYAHALGIRLDDISVVADGDLDARRLFGIEGGARAGFTAVRLEVTVTGPEPQSKYEELREIVDAHCPVYDLFANPTPVTVTIKKG